MSNNNFNENNGLMTKIWGPHMWIAIHSVVFGYPVNPTEEQKQQYKTFLEHLGFVLPCIYCRQSYQFFIKDGNTILTDEVLKNRKNLTEWVYNIHNRVNKKLGVDYGTTYEEMCDFYEASRAKCVVDVKDCQMPLELKAESYKATDKKQCNIIPKKVALYFKNYAEKRGIKFDKLDYYEDIITNKRNLEEYNNRNIECEKIIKFMRYNAIPMKEKDGEFKGLPTMDELKLMSLLCSSMQLCDLEDCVKDLNIGIVIKRKYKLKKSD
jgi:hypothetical protein